MYGSYEVTKYPTDRIVESLGTDALSTCFSNRWNRVKIFKTLPNQSMKQVIDDGEFKQKSE